MDRNRQILNFQTWDVDERQYECESCSNITVESATHSHIIGSYHISDKGYAGAQCSDTQHFSCSHEHAVQSLMDCIDNHTPDASGAEHDGSPLPNGLPTNCQLASCNAKINAASGWYQVAPCYAMRGDPSLPSAVYWELTPGRQQLWFCSFNHAKEAASYLVDMMEEGLPYGESESSANRKVKTANGNRITRINTGRR